MLPTQRLPLLSLLLLSASALPVIAQEAIEEIVVRAELRDRNIDRTPTSVSVVSPDEVGTMVNHLEEVLGRVPNVNLASGASRARFIQIRGIGERSQFGEPLNASVGLLVDGVDLSGIGTAATLYDVDQIEVLRGPQGTLLGANALAGLINVVTLEPTATHTARLRLDAGDYGALGVGFVVSGPLSEAVGYRVSGQKYRDNGFMDNDFLGRDDTDNHDEGTYRAKFTWQTAHADWQLVLGRMDIDNGYDAFSLNNDRTTLSDRPGADRQQTDYGALSLNADLSDEVAFESTLAFSESDIGYGYDEDWTFTGFDPIGYTSTDLYVRDRETTTVDARWLKQADTGWSWAVGAYAFRQEVDLRRLYTFNPGPFDSEFQIERLALYGEISHPLGERWRLSMGGRVERHQSDYKDSGGVAFAPDDDLYGGRVLLERDLGERAMLYVGFNQGFKSGGFNQDGSLPADLRLFDDETLWNVELGYKARLFDDRVGLRAALFRMQRDDIQVSTSTTRPIPGNPGAVEFIEYTGNAAQGYNQGLELEVEWYATERLMLFANLGVLDTELEDFIDNSGRDLDGRDQAHAPGYQFFVGADLALLDNLTLSLEVEGKDKYYFSASHSEQSDAYELINASLTYARERWRVRLWGRNLTDEDYFVRGFFFGNDPRDFYTERVFTQLGEPRQVGLSVELDI